MEYTPEDLKKATKNFDDGNCLGCGGFGSVYGGILRCTAVAVKVLNKVSE